MRALRRVIPSLARAPLLLSGVVLALVVLALVGPLLFRDHGLVLDDIFTSDLLANNVPPRAFLGRELREGRFPLWSPHIFAGLPLLAQGEAAAANPLTWLLYGAWDWVTATTLSVALHTWLAGFGMVLLARRLGARLPGALVAGVAFMLSGFMVGHVKHLNLHHAAAWLPWLVVAADRLRERPGLARALGLGVVAALQLTEGHPQMSYVSVFCALPIVLARLPLAGWRELRRARYWLRLGLALLGALAITVVLAGAYLFAGLELARASERASVEIDAWAYATRFELLPRNLLTLLSPYVLGDASDTSYDGAQGIFWENWYYLGTLPIGAAVLGVLAALRRAARRELATLGYVALALAVGLGSVALMFGKSSPFYAAAFDTVPGMQWFRFPQRFALGLELALALLAAVGVDALVGWLRRRGGAGLAALAGTLAVAVTATDLVACMARQFPGVAGAALRAAPATVALLAPPDPPEPWRVFTAFGPQSHVEAFGLARGWGGDLAPYLDQRQVLQASTNALWGLEALGGYTSMAPYGLGVVVGTHTVPGYLDSPLTHRAIRARECPGAEPRFSGACTGKLGCPADFAAVLGVFNVRYLVSPIAVSSCRGLVAAGTVERGAFRAFVYRNERVLPRAYVVPSVLDVADAREAGARLVSGSYRPDVALRTLPAAAQPSTPPSSADAARVQRTLAPVVPCAYAALEPDTRTVTCALGAPGYLVISDTRYPGQIVTLDGAEVEPFTANGFVLGLALEAGEHTVTVRYRPWYAGFLWVAVAAWPLAALVGLHALLRRRARLAARRP
ncbi:MAG: hypothetical protein IT373_11865 [Polyangiaceae bacterium]|nr:hypothetical protein [Polyangiaceae bacterium]